MRRAAVLGAPIGHSLSPTLHRAAYAALGLDWTYEAIEMRPDGLASFMLTRDETWAGLSLTMPLKEVVLELLDEADPLVRQTGAANTVVFRDGRRVGFNTDVNGIVNAVWEGTGETTGRARSATVIGAGATARSAVVALNELGVGSVSVLARRPDAARVLTDLARSLGLAADAVAWDQPQRAFRADVVISTLPPGAADQLASDVPDGAGVLLDVAYAPWPSRIAEAWTRSGGKVVSGLSMLTWQAAEQVRLMTGRAAPVRAMRMAVEAAAAG